MRIIGKVDGGELEIKRLYLEGVSVVGECPKCDAPIDRDYSCEYLSYPDIGKYFEEGFYCETCDHEWSVQLKLDINLSLRHEK